MRIIQTIIIIASLMLFGCKERINTKQKLIKQEIINIDTLNSKKNNSISVRTYQNKKKDYIYNKKIDFNSIKYKKYNLNLKGAKEWYCDKNYLRFLPVLTKDNINLILVPQDCGDFNYRYYLLVIFENTIVSNLYVEGEWYEPGVSKEEYNEITSFSIDSSYNIIVKKDIHEENTDNTDNTVINEYKISSIGQLEKLKR